MADDERLLTDSLDEKIFMYRKIVSSAIAVANNPIVCISGGLKSVVLLHLTRLEIAGIRVIYVQTNFEFENMVSFVGKLEKLWQLSLMRVTAQHSVAQADCCTISIERTLSSAMEQNEIDCLILGNLSEEPRKVLPSLGPGKTLVQPLYHFNRADIQEYARMHNLPTCSLYNRGYGKVDCKRCTVSPDMSRAEDKAAEQEKIIKDKMRTLGYL